MRLRHSGIVLALAVFPGLFFDGAAAHGAPASCTYTTYTWNVRENKSVDRHEVRHAYSALAPWEIHAPTGCTLCAEDQIAIELPAIAAFSVCKLIAEDVRRVLEELMDNDEPILSVVGYRVGMTKGDLDANGNRRQYSLHSYGVALDINEHQNGLYDRCEHFNTDCRLRRGGAWNPAQVGALTAESPIVDAMKSIGMRWGGNIAGRQKDFMHFSPSGY